MAKMRRELTAIAFAVLAGFGGSASAESPEVKAAKKACDAGNMDECLRLAYLYAEGKDADLKKAAATFKKVCDAGKPAACLELAQMYEDGDGVKQDDGDGAGAAAEASATAATARCASQLAEDDPGRAAVHFEQACNAGHTKGCYDGGLAYQPRVPGRAKDMATRGRPCTRRAATPATWPPATTPAWLS